LSHDATVWEPGVDILAVDFDDEVDIALMADGGNRSVFSLNELSFRVLSGGDICRKDHMLTNRKPEGEVRVREREAENVGVMGNLDLGAQSQLDVTVSILGILLQNTSLFRDQVALLFFTLLVLCLLPLFEEEADCKDECH
jgi:hypothetical protein